MATEKRLIDANALMEEARRCSPFVAGLGDIVDIELLVNDQPTVEAVEVVHGRWVDSYGGNYANQLYVCSECKKKALYKFEDDELHIGLWVQELTDYCPNCGAKMDGDGDV